MKSPAKKDQLNAQNPRQGWDQLLKKMHDAGDDQLLIDDVFEDEEFEPADFDEVK